MRSKTIIPDESVPQIEVRKLAFNDWGHHTEAAVNEVDRILKADLPGCWYINPMFYVHSPDPAAEFFNEVARRQGAWCRMLDRHFPKGWRTIRKQSKDRYQRGVEFEGVLIIEGEFALPEDIPEIRQLLGQLPTVIRRNQAFHLLKTRKLDELKNLTDGELRLRQSSDRSGEGHAYFILPHATVESPSVNKAFIEEATRRKGEWHRAVARLFPKSERRQHAEDVGDFCGLMPRGYFLNAGRSEEAS
jgi:hypothetical protein